MLTTLATLPALLAALARLILAALLLLTGLLLPATTLLSAATMLRVALILLVALWIVLAWIIGHWNVLQSFRGILGEGPSPTRLVTRGDGVGSLSDRTNLRQSIEK